MFSIFTMTILVALFSLAAPCFAGSDSNCHWSCDFNAHNSRIEVVVSTDYGTLAGVSARVRWKETPDGAWKDLINGGISANSSISRFFTPAEAHDGIKYLVQADFSRSGTIIDSESQLITWGNADSGTTGGGGPDQDGQQQQLQDQGGMFERIVAGVVSVPCTVIENLFKQAGGFKSLDQLVFLSGYTDDQKKNLPWEGKEPDMVRAWFQALILVTAPFFIIAVAVTGFKLLYAAANPPARSEAMESIQRWFLAVGIVALAPLVISTLMWITSIAVDAISGAFQTVASAVGMSRSVGDWSSVNLAGMQITTGSVLGTACVRLFMALMFGYLNVLYIVRKLALTVMFAFTPIMALLWALNKNSTAAMIWLGELASNAFMPVAHALVLCTILLICDVKNAGNGSWLTIIIMLYALIPTAEAIRNSLQSLIARRAGLNEERTATGAFFSALGLAGLMSLGRMGAATLGGGSKAALADTVTSTGSSLPLGGGPKPVRQIGFRPPGQSDAPPAGGSFAQDAGGGMSQIGFGSGIPPAASPGGMSPPIGDDVPGPGQHPSFQKGTTFRYWGGDSTQVNAQSGGKTTPPPGRHERAVNFGSAVGKAAALGTAGLMGMVAGAVPGGTLAIAPVARAVGAVSRIAATGTHLAAGHIAARAGKGLNDAAQKGSGLAQGTLQVGQKLVETSKRIASHPAVQRTAGAGQKLSVAIHSGINPDGAIKRARYMDSKGKGLDGVRER